MQKNSGSGDGRKKLAELEAMAKQEAAQQDQEEKEGKEKLQAALKKQLDAPGPVTFSAWIIGGMQIFDDTRAAGDNKDWRPKKPAPCPRTRIRGFLTHRRIAPKGKDFAIPSLRNGEVLRVQEAMQRNCFHEATGWLLPSVFISDESAA